ncbi:DUF1015 domain-containing protein [Candidatus Galacturonibacter soehngenii]|uniref:DUF1015 domain-containing protein n=1 Tax=Candidatus Galacturonatibacter soehngenii TaxID=2307010 RepID=A0A7V7QMN3_9FIRM|nr:DUF1015 family protein [Candidatus Galacturonibacter soehngenii]KAB1439990.1 DUF1015 domain-containing protein [Candidatus Galacturonibacter soehngenii]
MAIIKPFECVRPKKEYVSKIAALPYDVYNRAEALREVQKEPMSFLRIDRAETQFDESVDAYDERVYKKAHDILWDMIKQGSFEKDTKKCYYVYQLVMNGRSQTGLVACASIDDYENNIIKKHEKTREDKEIDRIKHVDTCNAQTGPIFLAYRSNDIINELVKNKMKEEAMYHFVAEDHVTHTVWKIEESKQVSVIEQAFQTIDQIYIADGHHRAASAVKVGLKRRALNQNHTGKEEYNFFLSVLFPDDQLMILPYNRVVKDLNGYSETEFLDKVKENFEVQEMGKEPYEPNKKATFGMYLNHTWYELTAKHHLISKDAVEGLDVSILQNYLLDPILNIKDPRTDKRIDFIGGIRGVKELERRVCEDMKVAFSMYPTKISELFEVADANQLMPPKSTWFEPKLRSGLFIHTLE